KRQPKETAEESSFSSSKANQLKAFLKAISCMELGLSIQQEKLPDYNVRQSKRRFDRLSLRCNRIERV
ncbi:hypothetical protein HN51_019994, partial [Arachis hypogaea]